MSLYISKNMTTMVDTQIFQEEINLDRARIVVSMPPKDIIETFNIKAEKNSNINTSTYVAFIKKWLYKRIISGDPIYKQKYKYAESMSRGRLYVDKFGLSSSPAKLRSFLSPSIYSDIDITNAYYSILVTLLDKHNSTCEIKLDAHCIREYVNNRKHILDMYHTDKYTLLVLLNSDKIHTNKKKGFSTKNPFLIRLHAEIMDIKKLWSKMEAYNHYFDESHENPYSSMLSKIISIEENRLLQIALRVIDQKQSIVPMFDGFLLEKVDESSQENMTIEFNKATHNDEFHSVSWKFKPIEDDAMNEEQYEKYETMSKQLLSSSLKAEYDDKHVFIKSTGLFKIKCKEIDGSYIWYNYKRQSMIIDGQNMHYIDNDGKTQTNYFLEWERDPERREYEREAYIPYPANEKDSSPAHIFNTFIPMPINYEPEFNEEPCNILREYLWNMADGREQEYIMLRSFLAQIVQQPHLSRHKALILTSFKNRGTGKNTYQTLAERLLGFSNTYSTAKIDDIMGKKQTSNGQLENRLFITLNEISWSDSKEYVDALKDVITSENSCVRKLYQETQVSKNYSRFLITANTLDCPVPISHESNRRYEWIRCENMSKCGDKEYWNMLYKNINDDEWISKIGNELLRDVLRKDEIIKTQEMMNSAQFNQSKEELFIQRLSSGELRDEYDKIKDGILYIKIPDLYDRYAQFLTEFGDGSFSKAIFRKRICEIDGVIDQKLCRFVKKNGKKSKHRMYGFNIEIIKHTLNVEMKVENIDVELDDPDSDDHY